MNRPAEAASPKVARLIQTGPLPLPASTFGWPQRTRASQARNALNASGSNKKYITPQSGAKISSASIAYLTMVRAGGIGSDNAPRGSLASRNGCPDPATRRPGLRRQTRQPLKPL